MLRSSFNCFLVTAFLFCDPSSIDFWDRRPIYSLQHNYIELSNLLLNAYRMECINSFEREVRVTAGYFIYYFRGKDQKRENIQVVGTRRQTKLLYYWDDAASMIAIMVSIRKA